MDVRPSRRPEPGVQRELGGRTSRSVHDPAAGGGRARDAFTRAARLELATDGAPATLSEVLVGLSVRGTLRSAQYDGLLGADFLTRFRVTFDYSRQRMCLEPRVPAPARAEMDMSGRTW